MKILTLLILLALAGQVQAQRFVKVLNTYADLANANTADVYTNAFVAGKTSPADGYQGIWTFVAGSAAPLVTNYVVAPNVGTGRWFRQTSLGQSGTPGVLSKFDSTGTVLVDSYIKEGPGSGTTGYQVPQTNLVTWLGSSTNQFAGIYASNGVFSGTISVGSLTATNAGPTNLVHLAFWGDSTIAPVTGGYDVPAFSGQLLVTSNYNGGVGGNTSVQIAARMVAGTAYHSWPTVLQGGINNSSATNQVIADFATMVAALDPGVPYLVLSVLNGSGEGIGTSTYNYITNINQRLSSTYGTNYVDIRRYLIQHYNPDNAQDVLDVAADIVPSSLRTDNIHPNSNGRLLEAQIISQTMVTKQFSPNTVLTPSNISSNLLSYGNAWSVSSKNLVATNVLSATNLTLQAVYYMRLVSGGDLYLDGGGSGGVTHVGPYLFFRDTSGNYTTVGFSTSGNAQTLNASAFQPTDNLGTDLGVAAHQWRNIYGDVLHLNTGTVGGAFYLNGAGTMVSAPNTPGILIANGVSGVNSLAGSADKVIKWDHTAGAYPVVSQITDDGTDITLPGFVKLGGTGGTGHVIKQLSAAGRLTSGKVDLTSEVTGILPAANGGSTATVTSVAMTMPAEWSVAGSPITTSGTLAVTKATQTANQLYAGPTSGGAAQPTFRTMVGADIPDALVVATTKLSATGTKNSSTFLRGDDTWATPAGGSGTFFDNPTASLGLVAINGSSTNAMRADAAPALSQAIVPTWTGQHIFRKTTTPLVIQYDSTHSLGIQVDSAGTPSYTSTTGTNAFVGIADASVGLTVAGAAASASYLRGDGTKGVFATLSADDLAAGTVPTARLGSGVANSSTFLRGDNTWAVPSGGSGTFFADPTASIGLSAINGTSTNAMRADAAPAISQSITPVWTGVHTFRNAVIPVIIGYDAGNYTAFSSSASGDLTITPTGGDLSVQGTLSSSVGYQVSGAAASGQYLRGDGTKGVFAALSASDLASGTVPTARLGSGAAGSTTFLSGDQSWKTAVTSVGLTMPGIFSVSGSPVTGSSSITVALGTQAANTVFAGPAVAGPSAPTFRALVAADIAGALTGSSATSLPFGTVIVYKLAGIDFTTASTNNVFTNASGGDFIITGLDIKTTAVDTSSGVISSFYLGSSGSATPGSWTNDNGDGTNLVAGTVANFVVPTTQKQNKTPVQNGDKCQFIVVPDNPGPSYPTHTITVYVRGYYVP